MFLTNQLRKASTIASIFILCACSSTQNKPIDDTENTSSEKVPGSVSATKAETKLSPQPVFVPNPTVINFEKMSTTLDGSSKQGIAQLRERAKNSQKITVTGFCDRRQIANADEAAVARAISVRDELLAQGIAPAKVTVKFNTKAARTHSAEIRFD